MKEGELKKRIGCGSVAIGLWGLPIFVGLAAVIVYLPFAMISLAFEYGAAGYILNGIVHFFLGGAIIYGYYHAFKFWKKRKNGGFGKDTKGNNPFSVILKTIKGKIILDNPFRGIFVIGAAGSGKSESVAVPLLQQFANKNFSGIVYDFKFPTLANDVESFLVAEDSKIKHYYLDFNNPTSSYRVNPLNPTYLPNTSYAREYAQAIISNLMKESIQKPDFWTRSATDLLTACIWYLREERPDICDLPHVFAMITSPDEALLNTLQKNPQTAQMTISIYNAMQRKADSQVSGVIGTLQGAIAQINTPELMYVFSGDDFSLDINNPANPIVLTVGSYPSLTHTFAPLCSLVITVATKLMNQPDKHQSFVMIDEAPTCFIPNLEILPNTGRSNKIATVLMCQDLAQFRDSYGKEKSDVLFASCNNHFYGRVASSITAETLSKQFGKYDKIYTTKSESGRGLGKHFSPNISNSETVQERDVIKPSEFLQFKVGEFAGIAVETNKPHFRAQFKQTDRPVQTSLKKINRNVDLSAYYKSVRNDIESLLNNGNVVGEQSRDTMPLEETNHNKFKINL